MTSSDLTSEICDESVSPEWDLLSHNQLDEICNLYQNDGALAANIPGYVFRKQQVDLVKAIYGTLDHKKILLAEAGTGTGKTLAYLIPALYHSKTTVISTGTKNLQNQLYFRDLPAVIKAIKLPVKIALLKGRANYLCKYRLEQALMDIFLSTSEMVKQFKQIVQWAQATTNGDISMLEDIPEDAEVWRHVTSTADNCLGQECPLISSCFVYKARQLALDAKIVVINHHLLLADWNLKEDNSEARLLPNGVNLILDEAHQLPEIASSHFGRAASSKKIKDLLQDVLLEQQQYAKDVKQFSQLNLSITRLLDQIQHYILTKPEKGFYSVLHSDPVFKSDLDNLSQLLQDLYNILEANAERSAGLKNCFERCLQLVEDCNIFSDDSAPISKSQSQSQSKCSNHDAQIKWYEIYKYNFVLKQSPLDISELFYKKLTETANSAVLASATISVAGDFSLIQNQLGLHSAKTIKISSPFDYKKQALLYIPRAMPDPKFHSYLDCYMRQVLPVLNACKGGAFLLFTSFNFMHQIYDRLVEHFSSDNSSNNSFNLLLQGKASKTALLQRFVADKNSVLLATASFWEGVDVKGADLHCVIIDKLPFESPTDPLLQAKIKHLREQNRDPFVELQCQQAVLQLTQGAGRLIRSEQDYGVLMICDPRIIGRDYGSLFLNALPPMARTRELGTVEQFYEDRLQ